MVVWLLAATLADLVVTLRTSNSAPRSVLLWAEAWAALFVSIGLVIERWRGPALWIQAVGLGLALRLFWVAEIVHGASRDDETPSCFLCCRPAGVGPPPMPTSCKRVAFLFHIASHGLWTRTTNPAE